MCRIIQPGAPRIPSGDFTSVDLCNLFLKVGKTWYKVSEEMLAWPQAQYSCMNMQGKMMMMEMMMEMVMVVMMNM